MSAQATTRDTTCIKWPTPAGNFRLQPRTTLDNYSIRFFGKKITVFDNRNKYPNSTVIGVQIWEKIKSEEVESLMIFCKGNACKELQKSLQEFDVNIYHTEDHALCCVFTSQADTVKCIAQSLLDNNTFSADAKEAMEFFIEQIKV
jgi:hypothetical protein